MKIVNIVGGLGNQMFQYSFAVLLKYKWPNEDVYIDITHYNHLFLEKVGASNLHNGYELNRVFPNVTLKSASPSQIRKLSRYIPNYFISRIARKFLPAKITEIIQSREDYFAYNPTIVDLEGDYYYEGIWEAVSYYLPIRDYLKHVFAHPDADGDNKELISSMEKQNSVGLHVRRGDYLYLEEFQGICDVDYYRNAITKILEDGQHHVFYVFSNDIKWCEDNITPLVGDNPIIFVTCNSGSNSCWDMFLMTHCKDLIIANSSFSWWGAFLNNRNGRVIAPDKWVNREAAFDIWLPEWIRL